MRLFAAYLVVLHVVIVSAVKWQDCGSVKTVQSVSVTGCETTDVCSLHQGSTVTVNVTFTAPADSAKATTVVHGIIAGIPTPFPLDDANACNNKGIACPVTHGTQYAYHQALPVKKIYPQISLVVEWEVQDANGKDLFCIKLPAKIVGPSKKSEDNALYFKGGNSNAKHPNAL